MSKHPMELSPGIASTGGVPAAPTPTGIAAWCKDPALMGLALGLLAFGALATVPIVGSSRYILYIGTLLALHAAVAVSLNIVIGYAGQFALSHAAFYGLGAYLSSILVRDAGMAFWTSLPLALIGVGVFAAVIGYPALRFTGGIHLALITFACGELMKLVASNWDSMTGGTQGMRLSHSPESVLGIDFTSNTSMYGLALAVLAVTLVASVWVRQSRFGRALVAIREDEVLAASIGINVTFHKLGAFVLSSMLAGLAGIVYAPFVGFISPDMMSTSESVAMVGMLIVGGIGTVLGPVIGVLVFLGLPEVLRVAKFYRLVILGVVIVLTVLFLPRGIVGTLKERARARLRGKGSR